MLYALFCKCNGCQTIIRFGTYGTREAAEEEGLRRGATAHEPDGSALHCWAVPTLKTAD